MKLSNYIFLFLIISVFLTSSLTAQELNKHALVADNKITIVDRTGIFNKEENPIAFGKRALFSAIEAAGGQIETVQYYSQTNQNVYLIVGTLDNDIVRRLVSDDAKITSNKPEGVFYQWKKTENGTALVIGGTDSKGLMYALNELAEQIKDKGLVALTELKNTIEYPENSIRGLDKFIKDEKDDSWFFSEDYWQYYIQQLAENRFNRLTLITGYNDGSKKDFMMPVYPYLLKVPGFEDIKPTNSQLKSPKEYLAQLRRIGEISHHYGLEFVFGIWSHGRSDELITGLPQDPVAYTKYCSNGLRELIRQVPEIDGIQLRVNYESGVGGFGDTAENFWKEIITAIGDGYKERNGKLFLDLRAKGLTVKIRKWVLETGLNLSVTSKYSWEGVGLPYHQTQMRKAELAMLDNNDKRQRYGYADFLYKSRDFEYINRLWGIGTMRIFTWADPDYVKRFSHTTSFGGAKGFQVTPPMARKLNDWNLFTNDSLIYYKWEDQRYWAWYELFGRLGYSTHTNPEVWLRTFKRHYGKSYKAVLDAYGAAGKVLPLITSSHLTYHPANYNWAEIESGGALFVSNNASPFHKRKERTYQSAEPGDPGLFYSIEDYVKDFLNDDVQAKINPVQLASLYENYSNKTLEALLKVNLEDIPKNYKKEFTTNEIDLKITAALSAYHSFKIKAATDFVFFQETQEKRYLQASLKNMEEAKRNWSNVVALTQELYYEKPFFLHDNGTWNDRLIEIEKDISELKELIGVTNTLEYLSHWQTVKKSTHLDINDIEAIVPDIASSKKDLKVTFKTNELSQSKEAPKVHYRIANMASGKFNELIMKWDGTQYSAHIPGAYLNPEYDLLIYFTWFNSADQVMMYPGLFSDKYMTPYFVVKMD